MLNLVAELEHRLRIRHIDMVERDLHILPEPLGVPIVPRPPPLLLHMRIEELEQLRAGFHGPFLTATRHDEREPVVRLRRRRIEGRLRFLRMQRLELGLRIGRDGLGEVHEEAVADAKPDTAATVRDITEPPVSSPG